MRALGFVTIMLWGAAALAQPLPRLMVLGSGDTGVDAALLEAARTVTTHDVTDETRRPAEDLWMLVGCSTAAAPCLSELADLLGARALLWADIGPAGSVTARLFDAESGSVESTSGTGELTLEGLTLLRDPHAAPEEPARSDLLLLQPAGGPSAPSSASRQRRAARGFGVAAVVASAGVGAAAIATGVQAQATRRDFERTPLQADAARYADEGAQQARAANALAGASIGLAATAVVLWCVERARGRRAADEQVSWVW